MGLLFVSLFLGLLFLFGFVDGYGLLFASLSFAWYMRFVLWLQIVTSDFRFVCLIRLTFTSLGCRFGVVVRFRCWVWCDFCFASVAFGFSWCVIVCLWSYCFTLDNFGLCVLSLVARGLCC